MNFGSEKKKKKFSVDDSILKRVKIAIKKTCFLLLKTLSLPLMNLKH